MRRRRGQFGIIRNNPRPDLAPDGIYARYAHVPLALEVIAIQCHEFLHVLLSTQMDHVIQTVRTAPVRLGFEKLVAVEVSPNVPIIGANAAVFLVERRRKKAREIRPHIVALAFKKLARNGIRPWHTVK